jgi:1,4-alpha-glucan branching enzyme
MTMVKADGSVEFRFFRPNASQVCIAGDFNEWSGSGMRMQPQGDGWWLAQTPLPPGEYRFRYLADGKWFTDYAAHGVELGPAGWNGVLVVPGPRRRGSQMPCISR